MERESGAWLGVSGYHRLFLVVTAVAFALPLSDTSAFEQLPSDDQVFHERATRALAHGDDAEANALVESRDESDPLSSALRARLLIERGEYTAAETLLKTVAKATPSSAAGLEFGLLLQRLGRVDEGRPFLEAVIVSGMRSDDARLKYQGALAARAIGGFREANRLLRSAAQIAPDDPAIQAAWGQLFLEKYNYPDALASFQAALMLDDQWVPAHIGVARVLINENPPVARSSVDRALELNPQSVDGHLFIAELELNDRNREEARDAIDAALSVNPENFEAHALIAAIAYLEDRIPDFEAEVARTLKVNPVYGDIYRIVGNHVARAYRFPEAVRLVQRALELEPGNTRARAELGMHLLRTGDELGARGALEQSFTDDPFDIVTYNLLEMLDQLKEFETFEQSDLIVRLHPDEAPTLRKYVFTIAQEAIDELADRYEMDVQPPILIEVFPRHDDFAVRNLGLPGMIGALGACFGSVVTMDSPRARPPGDFNWQSTLWHEIAHVVTLQMSNQRLPRWLSEGISTYEEKRRYLAWGRDATLEFVSALNNGTLLSIRELNSGFTRPETISLSYFQASVLVEHLIDTYGMEALRTLIRAYGDGLETEQALTRIGLDFERLQKSFNVVVEEQFGELRLALLTPDGDIPAEGAGRLEALRVQANDQPGNFHAQFALGREAHLVGETEEARVALEQAAALVPMATGFDSPRGILAQIAADDGNSERAMRELELLLKYDETSVEAVRMLASLAEDTGDDARRRFAYERLIEIDPFDPISHQVLGRLALNDGRADVARHELTVALSLEPVDRVAAHVDLAESLLLVGDFADAKRQVMAALEMAPSYVRAQDLLLSIIEAEPEC